MTTSLFGERSVASASPANPLHALFVAFAQMRANRSRRMALKGLLNLDADRLHDLGISRTDILEALQPVKGRTSAMVLNAARARNARS